MPRAWTALALFTVLFATTTAHAEETTDTQKPAKTESRWYGYQTLAADAGALGLVALAVASDNESTAQVGFLVAASAVYVFAPTGIHVAHGSPSRAIGDAALRLGAPVVGAGLGAIVGFAATNDRELGGLYGVVVGGIVGLGCGVAGAIALDASVLAYETTTPQKQAARTGPTFAPSLGPTKGGFAAGLSGTF